MLPGCTGFAVGRGGVPGDTFECVDAADTYVKVVVSELVDGACEAFGDLSFAVDLDLAPGRYRSRHHKQAGYRLEKGGSDVVLQLGLCLLQLDPCLGAIHCLQVRIGQRRIQQLGSPREAGEHEDQQAYQAQDKRPMDSWGHKGQCFYSTTSGWKPSLGGRRTP